MEELRTLPHSHLDRLAVQKLFGVRERRARQIMAGLPGLRAGNALAVERQALVAWLEKLVAGEVFQREIGRRQRVVEDLERTRQELAARRIRIRAPEQPLSSLPGWSSGIDLRPGELRIRFHGAEDLAAKLFELSQAMARDWLAFSQQLE